MKPITPTSAPLPSRPPHVPELLARGATVTSTAVCNAVANIDVFKMLYDTTSDYMKPSPVSEALRQGRDGIPALRGGGGGGREGPTSFFTQSRQQRKPSSST